MRPITKVNPQTGTLKQTRPVTKSSLLHNMSKFAAIILLTGSSFAAMSYNQEDLADANDTGIKAGHAMELRNGEEVNIVMNMAKENSSIRNKGIYLSLPDQKSRMRADYETFRQFVLSANASIIKQAWKAPSASAIAHADEEVNNDFADYAARHLVNPSGKYISQADDEMTENFALENFRVTKPSASLIAKADIEVTNDFEAENNPKISMPSSELVKKADLEMGYRIKFDSKN
jgi:hypothetical protein